MPVSSDIVHESTNDSGTASMNLRQIDGRQRFSEAFGTGTATDVFYYYILSQNFPEWEFGTGHISTTAAGNDVLVRDTVIRSSNANYKIDFRGGQKDVVSDYPSSIQLDIFSGITRSEFSKLTLPTTGVFTLSGYNTVNDFGQGAPYTAEGASPTGPMAIQDATGTWFNLAIPKDFHVYITWFGASGDGITDDSTAWQRFQTWAQLQTDGVILTIPPGNYTPMSYGRWPEGISKLTVYGYSARYIIAIGAPIPQLAKASARIQSTTIGATTVTAIVPADAGMFANGDWGCLCSLEMQGDAGFPPNWYNNEYHEVTNVNIGTGVITLNDRVRYSHLSTYPVTARMVNDLGGPASLFTLRPEWNQCVYVYGGTLDSQGGQTEITGREFFIRDVHFIGEVSATCSKNISFKNCIFETVGAQFEVDKNVEIISFEDCTFNGSLVVQSASIGKLIINRCYLGYTFSGTSARQIDITDSFVDTISVVGSYGAGESLSVKNCTINSIVTSANPALVLSSFTFSNGTFSILSNNASTFEMWKFGIPGGRLLFTGTNDNLGYNWGNPAVITNIREDGTHTYVDTTLGAALPVYTGGGSVVSDVQLHPCRRMEFTNVTGGQASTWLSQQPSGLPVFSYGRQTLSGNFLNTTNPFTCWGYLTQLRIKVIRAYTGAAGAMALDIGGANYDAANVWGNWTASVDLKTLGERVVTQTAVTGSVGADAIVAPGAVWFQGVFGMTTAVDISGDTEDKWPIVEIEMLTDQGVTGLSVFQTGTTQLW